MIGVKIPVSCYLFLIAMQDSLRYCFADDTDSWFFLINPWIWKFQNWAKDSIFRGRSIENSLKYFLRWNSRGCWLSNFKCLYFDIAFYNHQSVSFYNSTLISSFLKGKDDLSLFEWLAIVYCYIFIIVIVYYKNLQYAPVILLNLYNLYLMLIFFNEAFFFSLLLS